MERRVTGSREDIDRALATIAPVDVATAEHVLREAKAIMDQLGVAFFLRQGTCLGAVRDNAILPWDDDIDIGSVVGLHGLTEASFEIVVDQVVDAFTEKGFSTEVQRTSAFLYVVLVKSSVRIDWHCYYVINGTIQHWPPKRFPLRLFTELKQIDFLGQQYFVPNPPEDYLALKYGEEWRVPKPAGSYEQDVVDSIPDSPTASGIRRLVHIALARIFRKHPAEILVLDHEGKPVSRAKVHVAGVGPFASDEQGKASLFIPEAFDYALTIRFGNHEELLYIETLAPGRRYTYRADSQTKSGGVHVLSED